MSAIDPSSTLPKTFLGLMIAHIISNLHSISPIRINSNSFILDAQINIESQILKSQVHILVGLGRSFDIFEIVLPRELFGLGLTDGSFVSQVGLVGDENLLDVGVGVVLDLLEPVREIRERFPV